MNIKKFKGGYDKNFTYVIDNGKDCFIIDPAFPFEDIMQYIKKSGFQLNFVIFLHSHFDHIMDLDKYKEKKNLVYGHESTPIWVDKKLKDKDTIGIPDAMFTVLHTPGHKHDCICLYTDKILFTSDTLFVEGCGRVDLPGADPDKMFDTLQKLKSLPDDTIIYPGHDYGSTETSTIGKEKTNNRFFKMNKEEFMQTRL